MKIRKAEIKDLEKIEEIYKSAREFMRKSGNLHQWTAGYPKREVILSDMEKSELYVCEDESGIAAVFCLLGGEEPTYNKIYNGSWLNGNEYRAVHRIAVSETCHGKGVAAFCMQYAFDICHNVKIDTHRDNIPMQKMLLKNGFKYCGIIYLLNGDERLAYQKTGEA